MAKKVKENESKSTLTDEQKNELIGAIAGDLHQRASWLQAIQLVQTQCMHQAQEIVDNATDEECQQFIEQLKQQQKEAAESQNKEE